MRMRQGSLTLGAALAVSAALLPTAAFAQGVATTRSAGTTTAMAGVVAREIRSAPATPAPPPVVQATRLDATWARALSTVMDDMHRAVRTERRAVLRTLASESFDEDDDEGGLVLPAVTFGYGRPVLPPGALRDTLAQSPWELGPVYVEPGTETPVDTRGEHGWIPGAYLHLPWLLP